VDFLTTYLAVVAKKPWLMGTFFYEGNTGEMKALHTAEGLEFAFFCDKQKQSLSL